MEVLWNGCLSGLLTDPQVLLLTGEDLIVSTFIRVAGLME